MYRHAAYDLEVHRDEGIFCNLQDLSNALVSESSSGVRMNTIWACWHVFPAFDRLNEPEHFSFASSSQPVVLPSDQ